MIPLKIIQGRQFQDWHNTNLDMLKSTLDQIDEMHRILAATMIYGVSFDYVNGYVVNTPGGVIYKGNSFVIPVQKILAPKDGQYLYLKNIETGEIAVSSGSTSIDLARYQNGKFDYAVRSSIFKMDTTDLVEASEGSVRFDTSKGVFAVYHNGEWLYEHRTSIIYTSSKSFDVDESYDVVFTSTALYPCSMFALLRYSAEAETAVITTLKVGGVTKDTATTAVSTGSVVSLESKDIPTQSAEYKLTISPTATISVDSIICGFTVGD